MHCHNQIILYRKAEVPARVMTARTLSFTIHIVLFRQEPSCFAIQPTMDAHNRAIITKGIVTSNEPSRVQFVRLVRFLRWKQLNRQLVFQISVKSYSVIFPQLRGINDCLLRNDGEFIFRTICFILYLMVPET